MTKPSTALAKSMVAKADADGLPSDHILRTAAAAFDVASNGFFAEVQTHTVKQFMSAWSRARKTWFNYNNREPLL